MIYNDLIYTNHTDTMGLLAAFILLWFSFDSYGFCFPISKYFENYLKITY